MNGRPLAIAAALSLAFCAAAAALWHRSGRVSHTFSHVYVNARGIPVGRYSLTIADGTLFWSSSRLGPARLRPMPAPPTRPATRPTTRASTSPSTRPAVSRRRPATTRASQPIATTMTAILPASPSSVHHLPLGWTHVVQPVVEGQAPFSTVEWRWRFAGFGRIVGSEISLRAGAGFAGTLVITAIPLYAVLPVGFVFPVTWVAHRVRRARRSARGLCPDCAQDLSGNSTGACPRCGADLRR